jgi:hypothetical protein
MFDNYRAFRDSGLTVFGSALLATYVSVVAGPILLVVDWYGRNHVGETGFEFDEDFDGNVEFIEDPPFGKFNDIES